MGRSLYLRNFGLSPWCLLIHLLLGRFLTSASILLQIKTGQATHSLLYDIPYNPLWVP